MQIISEKELKKHGTTWSLSRQAVALVNQQKSVWPLAGANYRSLRAVETKTFHFGLFRVECHFNPGRIRSSAANTSEEAIRSRPCFLCRDNLPAEQGGLPYPGNFLILVNPFPIFPCHLTIPSVHHTPQLIKANKNTFLRLSKDLHEFTLFYNGQQCGASAPDHFHFQAGIRNFLPLEEELPQLLKHQSEVISEEGAVRVTALENCLRRFIVLQSAHAPSLTAWIGGVIDSLDKRGQEEPMINMVTWYAKKEWTVLIFPRERQRPWQYDAEEPLKMVVSPAAVELCGIVILPRREDFEKITAADLEDIFGQVCLNQTQFNHMKEKLATFARNGL